VRAGETQELEIASRSQHLDRVLDLGADDAFDYHSVDPREIGRYDVIVDPVGRELRSCRRLLSPAGRMTSMIVDRVYPLEDIASAHRSVEAGGGFGKRVVVQ
jgi:NADPH:quinone reductase-like Zn-dependent oxidoreductase